MKMRNIYAACIVLLVAGMAQGYWVSRHIRYTGYPAFQWRDGSAMSTTNKVMGVVDVNCNGIEPPGTNAVNGYVGSGDAVSTDETTPPAVGYDGLTYFFSNSFYGQVAGAVEGDTTGTTCMAVYRCFSALAATQAAYYVDGDAAQLNNPPPPSTNFYAAYPCNKVNPAYSMMGFDTMPIPYPSGSASCISGSVNAVSGGGNNLLGNSAVMVYWRTNSSPWQALSNLGVSGNGDFTGTVVAGVQMEFMVGMTNVAGSLPNSLLGQGYVVTNTAVSLEPYNFFWTNTLGGSWSVAGNWTNDLASGSAPDSAGNAFYSLNFNETGSFTAVNDLNSGFQLNRLTFGGATARLRGNDLTLTNADAQLPQINQNSAATVIFSNNMVLATNVTIGGTGTGLVSQTGVLTGPGGFTITAPCMVLFNGLTAGANTYSGGTRADRGTLVIGQKNAFGPGDVTLGNGVVFGQAVFEGNSAAGALPNAFVLSGGTSTFYVAQSSIYKDIWISRVISGSGMLAPDGGGNRQLSLAGDNTFSGGVLLKGTGGGLNILHTNALGVGTVFSQKPTIHGGSVGNGYYLRAGANLSASPGVPNTFLVDTNCYLPIRLANPMLISGSITGSGGLSKNGTATLTLSGANTYTGPTVVIQGTLECTTPESVGAGHLIISNGAVVNLNFPDTRVVVGLNLGGTNQPAGTYGSTNSAATYQSTYFDGTGTVTVAANPAQPLVVITNAPVLVSYDVTEYVLGGTNNSYVVGGMTVSNADNGAAAVFSAAAEWTTPALPIYVGTNVFWVFGTNMLGLVTNDTVVIVRGCIGTGRPWVGITNDPQLVSYDMTEYVLGGTNNIHVFGDMWISNATVGGAAVAFSAQAEWTSAAIGIEVGTNALAVWVTNVWGWLTNDTVVIERIALPTDFFWTNSAGGVWSVAGNWTNELGISMAPNSGGSPYYSINFSCGGTYTATNDFPDGFVLNKLTFGAGLPTLTGNRLTFTNDGANLPQVNHNVAVNLNVSNDFFFATNVTFAGAVAQRLNYYGAISGPGGLIKNGACQVYLWPSTLRMTNTYAGGTILNSGTLFGLGGYPGIVVFGTGPITVNGGSFQPQQISVSNVNEITFNGGTLANPNSFGTAWYGPIILNTNFPMTGNGSINLYGNISGPGGINWTDTVANRSLGLFGTNTYTGLTTVMGQSCIICWDVPAIPPGSLDIRTNAVVRLPTAGTRVIDSLYLGGINQEAGEYGAIGSSAPNQSVYFTNSVGTVTVVGSLMIDITNITGTINTTNTTQYIAGTNNALVVGGMWWTNSLGGGGVLDPAPGNWNFVASIYPGTNIITVSGTNVSGNVAIDTVTMITVNPADVQNLQIGRVDNEGGYRQMRLSWSNGAITVLACTNRTYTTNASYWFVLASGVSTPWTHTAASNFPSVYYRIASGSYTSAYDVGKYDVDIRYGSYAWISFPFAPQTGCDTLSEWFGRQLELRNNSAYDFPYLQKQSFPGGTIENSDYYIADLGDETTNWFPNSTVGANAGYILFLPRDHGAVKLTSIGMVPTNNLTMQIPYNSVPWLGLAYPVVLDMRSSGLTNMLQPPRQYSGRNYDYVDSQQTPGGRLMYADYFIDNWGAGSINFFPSVTGADTFEPGKGYLLFFSTTRTGTGVWTCSKPY